MKPIRTGRWLLASLALTCGLSAQTSAHPRILRIVLRDTVQPVSAEYLERGLKTAASDHAQAVLVELDTPGGLLESTRAMVGAIEYSSVPVIIYVAPAGSRAASAGFFLLESADVAAMAPGTNTGASHPILEGQRMDPVLKQKIENDAAAFLRSIVARRHRNAQAAEEAVRDSKSYSDQEALDLHLIDRIAPSETALLQALNGTAVARFDGSTAVLNTSSATMETFAPDVRERILGALMDPNFAVLLLVVGALLIYLEFHVPGTIIPGSLGTLLVLLSLFALNLLPMEATAGALLLSAFILLLLELKFTSHGILALAGIICLVFGLLTLVNGPIPELRVHPATALSAGIGFGAVTFLLTALAMRARRNKSHMGGEALLGAVGVAQTDLNPANHPAGQILLHGALWQVRCTHPIPAGEPVRVLSRDELMLTVERAG